jgi:hypothetical protein
LFLSSQPPLLSVSLATVLDLLSFILGAIVGNLGPDISAFVYLSVYLISLYLCIPFFRFDNTSPLFLRLIGAISSTVKYQSSYFFVVFGTAAWRCERSAIPFILQDVLYVKQPKREEEQKGLFGTSFKNFTTYFLFVRFEIFMCL